jgi:hypothetical protein
VPGGNGKPSAIPIDVEAVLSLVGSLAVKRAAARVPQSVWGLSANELEERLRPTSTARSLREALWQALGRAVALGQGVRTSDIADAAGVSYDTAHAILTSDPAMLAWLLLPLRQRKGDAEDALLASEILERVSDVVRLPLMDRRGRVNVRNAKLILRAVEVMAPLLRR